jgi:DNA-binding response OmpR family regulator
VPATWLRVLVAVGNPDHRRGLSDRLRDAGIQVVGVGSGLDALSHVRGLGVDAAVVELRLPELDALELIARIRRESTLPIIVLLPQSCRAMAVAALEAGADDCVPESCPPSEIVARTRAVIRRARSFESEPCVLRSALVELDLNTRRCVADGREVGLARREFDLLCALMSYEGRIHTRSQLLALVWGGGAVSEKTVDGHVASLRRKLGTAIDITTVRRVGYRVEPTVPAPPETAPSFS